MPLSCKMKLTLSLEECLGSFDISEKGLGWHPHTSMVFAKLIKNIRDHDVQQLLSIILFYYFTMHQ